MKIFRFVSLLVSRFIIIPFIGICFGLWVLTFGFSVSAMTLKESVDTGLKNNPAVLTTRKKLDASQARLSQAMGAFAPTIKLDGNYGKSYAQPSAMQMGAMIITVGTDEAANTQGWTASLSQPIFVAALFPGLKIAQKSVDISREDLRKIIIDTSFNVTQTYFGVLRAEKMVKLMEESKDMAQSHLDQVSAMLAAGVSTRADLLRAEVQVANSEVNLTKMKNALEIAKDAFNNAVGRDLETVVTLEEMKLSGTIALMLDYKSVISAAFDARPDWRQYLLTRQISEENLKVAQTGYLPSAVLTGNIGNRQTENSAYKMNINSWTLMGAASWILFDGLGTQNRIREAAANLEAQQASEEQVKNGISLQVRDTYLNLKTALAVVGSTKKAVDSAEESYKVSDLRYTSGMGTNLEVIDAQVDLTQARFNNLNALFDVEIGRARVNNVVGKEVL